MADYSVLHELLACWVSAQLLIVPTQFVCKYTGTTGSFLVEAIVSGCVNA